MRTKKLRDGYCSRERSLSLKRPCSSKASMRGRRGSMSRRSSKSKAYRPRSAPLIREKDEGRNYLPSRSEWSVQKNCWSGPRDSCGLFLQNVCGIYVQIPWTFAYKWPCRCCKSLAEIHLLYLSRRQVEHWFLEVPPVGCPPIRLEGLPKECWL